MLHMRSLCEEHNGRNACNDANSHPTLRTRVHRISLAPPLDAQTGSKVRNGLSMCLYSQLEGALHRNAMEVFAYSESHQRETGHPYQRGVWGATVCLRNTCLLHHPFPVGES